MTSILGGIEVSVASTAMNFFESIDEDLPTPSSSSCKEKQNYFIMDRLHATTIRWDHSADRKLFMTRIFQYIWKSRRGCMEEILESERLDVPYRTD